MSALASVKESPDQSSSNMHQFRASNLYMLSSATSQSPLRTNAAAPAPAPAQSSSQSSQQSTNKPPLSASKSKTKNAENVPPQQAAASATAMPPRSQPPKSASKSSAAANAAPNSALLPLASAFTGGSSAHNSQLQPPTSAQKSTHSPAKAASRAKAAAAAVLSPNKSPVKLPASARPTPRKSPAALPPTAPANIASPVPAAIISNGGGPVFPNAASNGSGSVPVSPQQLQPALIEPALVSSPAAAGSQSANSTPSAAAAAAANKSRRFSFSAASTPLASVAAGRRSLCPAPDSREAVSVVVRCRPFLSNETGAVAKKCVSFDAPLGQIALTERKDMRFTFDAVYDEKSSQKDLYDKSVRPIVDLVLQGFNGAIFAYGQTSSGKTYTMQGCLDPDKKELLGVIPTCGEHILSHIYEQIRQNTEKKEREASAAAATAGLVASTAANSTAAAAALSAMSSMEEPSFALYMQYLEVYNERVFDLLAPAPVSASGSASKPSAEKARRASKSSNRPSLGSSGAGISIGAGLGATRPALEIRGHAASGFIVPDLSKHVIEKPADLYRLMKVGGQNRTTSETEQNATSSRSHAMMTLILEQKTSGGNARVSKLQLVDLAGSEKLNANEESHAETKNINKSLLYLSRVIESLAAGTPASYRDSNLTKLLADSLGGNSKTLMISCINPCARNEEETLSTLRYADKAKRIQNKPKLNATSTGVDQSILEALHAEIAALRVALQKANTVKEVVVREAVRATTALTADAPGFTTPPPGAAGATATAAVSPVPAADKKDGLAINLFSTPMKPGSTVAASTSNAFLSPSAVLTSPPPGNGLLSPQTFKLISDFRKTVSRAVHRAATANRNPKKAAAATEEAKTAAPATESAAAPAVEEEVSVPSDRMSFITDRRSARVHTIDGACEVMSSIDFKAMGLVSPATTPRESMSGVPGSARKSGGELNVQLETERAKRRELKKKFTTLHQMCTTERAKHRQYEQKWKDSDQAWKAVEAGWKTAELQLTQTLSEMTEKWNVKERAWTESAAALQKQTDELIQQRDNDRVEWAQQSEANAERQRALTAQFDALRAEEAKLMDSQRTERDSYERSKTEYDRTCRELTESLDSLKSKYAIEQQKATERESSLTTAIATLESAVAEWKSKLEAAAAEYESKRAGAERAFAAERAAFEEKFSAQNAEWKSKFDTATADREALIASHTAAEQKMQTQLTDVSAEWEQRILSLVTEHESKLRSLTDEHQRLMTVRTTELEARMRAAETEQQTDRTKYKTEFKSQLAAAQAEHQRAVAAAETALAAAKSDAAANATAKDSASAQALADQRAEHEAAVAKMKASVTAKVGDMKQKFESRLKSAAEKHASAMAAAKASYDADAEAARTKHDQQLKSQRTEYETARSLCAIDHDRAVTEWKASAERERADFNSQLAAAEQRVAACNAEREKAIESLRAAHDQEVKVLSASGDAAVVQSRQTLEAERAQWAIDKRQLQSQFAAAEEKLAAAMNDKQIAAESARVAAVEYERNTSSVEAQIRTVQSNADAAVAEWTAKHQTAMAAITELQRAKTELEARAQSERDAAAAQHATLTSASTQHQQHAMALRRSLSVAEDKYLIVSTEVSTLAQQIQNLTNELNRAREQHASTRASLDELRRVREREKAHEAEVAAKLMDEYRALQAESERYRAEATAEKQELKSQIERSAVEITSFKERITELETDFMSKILSFHNEISRLNEENRRLNNEIDGRVGVAAPPRAATAVAHKRGNSTPALSAAAAVSVFPIAATVTAAAAPAPVAAAIPIASSNHSAAMSVPCGRGAALGAVLAAESRRSRKKDSRKKSDQKVLNEALDAKPGSAADRSAKRKDTRDAASSDGCAIM